MKSTISPQQVFLVLQMFFGTTDQERERKFGDVKAAHRDALIDQEVLRVEKRGRGKYLLLADGANEFIMKNLGTPLPSRAYAGRVLQAVLGKVGEFLQTEGHSLEDVFHPSLARVSAPSPSASDPARAIRDAYLKLTHGEKRLRVRLADLRPRIDVSKDVLDATLLEMQAAGQLILYKLDNSAEISDADRQSTLYIGQEPRHIVYLEA